MVFKFYSIARLATTIIAIYSSFELASIAQTAEIIGGINQGANAVAGMTDKQLLAAVAICAVLSNVAIMWLDRNAIMKIAADVSAMKESLHNMAGGKK